MRILIVLNILIFLLLASLHIARNDTKIYMPLCVIIATISFLIAN